MTIGLAILAVLGRSFRAPRAGAATSSGFHGWSRTAASPPTSSATTCGTPASTAPSCRRPTWCSRKTLPCAWNTADVTLLGWRAERHRRRGIRRRCRAGTTRPPESRRSIACRTGSLAPTCSSSGASVRRPPLTAPRVDCDNVYVQASQCVSDPAPVRVSNDSAQFILQYLRVWRHTSPASAATSSRVYYVASCNDCTNGGDGIPTLKRIRKHRQWPPGNRRSPKAWRTCSSNTRSTPTSTASPARRGRRPTSCRPNRWRVRPHTGPTSSASACTLLMRSSEPGLTADTTPTLFDLGPGHANVACPDRFRCRLLTTTFRLNNVAGRRETDGNRHARDQIGSALIVAIIFLLLLSTLALAGLRSSTTNVQIVGNMQARQEAQAAAQMLIEQTVSTDEFARNPAGVFTGSRKSRRDVNGDGTATPPRAAIDACLRARPVPLADLDPDKNRPTRSASAARRSPIPVVPGRRRTRRIAVRRHGLANQREGHGPPLGCHGHAVTGCHRAPGNRRTDLQLRPPCPTTNVFATPMPRLAWRSPALALAASDPVARADDIDAYSNPPNAGRRPNVLFIFDNTANWSAASPGGKCLIRWNRLVAANVSAADQSTKFGAEKCALYRLIDSMTVGDLPSSTSRSCSSTSRRTRRGYPRQAFVNITTTRRRKRCWR